MYGVSRLRETEGDTRTGLTADGSFKKGGAASTKVFW